MPDAGRKAAVLPLTLTVPLVAVLPGPWTVGASHGPSGSDTQDPRRVGIGFWEAIPSDIYTRVDAAGGEVLKTNARLKLVLAQNKTSATQSAFMDNMRVYSDTEYVVPDVRGHLALTPNDSLWQYQDGSPQIHAPAPWDITRGSRTVKVAVIDTGVHCLHEDLSFLGPNDVVQSICDPLAPGQTDAEGHGTIVTGVLAGVINNTKGIAGIAQITAYPIPVVAVVDHPSAIEVAVALALTVDAGIKIASMSIAFYCETPAESCIPLAKAVEIADQAGVLMIAAAGNEPCSVPISYPANYTAVVAVAGWDGGNGRYGQCGDNLDLIAPFPAILTTTNGLPSSELLHCQDPPGDDPEPPAGYCYAVAGTSLAVPHVSGTAALIWSRCPALTRDEVRNALLTTAISIGKPANEEGHGRLDASGAVETAC